MAKPQRFRWIPMLLEAYQEAKSKSSISANTMPSPSRPVAPSTLTNEREDNQDNLAQHSLPASTAKNQAKRLPPPPRRMANGRQGTSAFPLATPPLSSVIRELRNTRKKLDKMEANQAQLSLLQNTLDRRLEELQAKLNPPHTHGEDAQSEEPSNPVTPST